MQKQKHRDAATTTSRGIFHNLVMYFQGPGNVCFGDLFVCEKYQIVSIIKENNKKHINIRYIGRKIWVRRNIFYEYNILIISFFFAFMRRRTKKNINKKMKNTCLYSEMCVNLQLKINSADFGTFVANKDYNAFYIREMVVFVNNKKLNKKGMNLLLK